MRRRILDLEALPDTGVSFDEQLELPELQLGGEACPVKRATLRGRVEPGDRGVELDAVVEAELTRACSRCLEPLDVALRHRFRLTLVGDAIDDAAGETELDPADAALFYGSDGKVDLQEVAAEQIYLNLPQKPLCREDCRGLCPTCGADRNRVECACPREAVDPRLAPLLQFKRRGNA
ncbi:MAG TPA: DUF177 domain-containing protein [Candidatus Polarisedimenticolaceae bacterium]|nr:DUF177 domain-containing protein [Candidatus Polarisedimenticolaceae bacterium]